MHMLCSDLAELPKISYKVRAGIFLMVVL